MSYNGHGGGCCGIHHLWGLDRMSLETFDNHVREHFAPPNNNRILEVIISDRQTRVDPADARFHRSIIAAGGWPAVLASRGFRLAERWLNSNSRNMCYRFVKLEGAGFVEEVPDWWTGDNLRIEETPPVERIVRQPEFAVGDTIRYNDGRIGTVSIVRADYLSVNFEDGGHANVLKRSCVKVNLVEERPYPIDPTLPLEIAGDDGAVIPVIFSRTAPLAEGGMAIYTRDHGWFHADTGEYGTRTVYYGPGIRNGRLRNRAVENVVRPAVPAAPAAPTVVSTEYFARFQNGTIRGPFESQEAVHEAYPRVLSFVARRILSDGTTRSDPPARF